MHEQNRHTFIIAYLRDQGIPEIAWYTFLMEKNTYDVIILGGGPGGLTAAIYTGRAHLKTLVFAGSPPGGQLVDTTDVENYPGFPKGVLGPELIENMRLQAQKFGAELVNLNALSVSGTLQTGFTVTSSENKDYFAKSVILATGASAKWLGLESEQRLRSKGVSACAVCDGFFFKGKVVAVVGGGDVAMEEAVFLTKYASKVYVLVRGSKEDMKACQTLQQRAFENAKIEFVFNTEVQEVLGENNVKGVSVINNLTQSISELELQGLFIAIGHKPNTDFLKGYVELDEFGYIKVSNNTRSSVEGVFVGGDVSDYRYRQAVTAAGLGCMAALDAEKLLASYGMLKH